jgi:peptidyl-prolyl cis-trans isomerase D
MFEFFRTHTRLLQFLLVLLIFPSFVFFGVQGYSNFQDASNTAVAKVGGHNISRAEWDAAYQRQVEQMRRQMPGVDIKLFDTPEFRGAVLEALVRENVVLAAANKLHLAVSDERLHRIFTTDPQFAALRNADLSVNKELLAAQGMTSEMFATQLRQQLAQQQVLRGVSASALAASSVAGAALDALLQRREIAYAKFDAKALAAKAAPSEAELETYYKEHEAEFRAPEQATIDYVVLDLESLKKELAVSVDEARKYYNENAARYTVAEERRARHILVSADKDASAEAKQKAKGKAEQLLAELRKSPGSFQELAKKNSDDPVSAAQGGDLGFFTRGGLAAKAVEDAVFAMKPGEISNVVISDFGYHIVLLEATRGGDKKPFETVRAQIEDEIRKQMASKRWAEAAEQFTNTVYEQADSLQPVIDKLKLEKRSATVTRAAAPGAAGALASAKLLDAIFGNEVLRNKRNTDAVEVGSNQLAAARVTQYQPARTRPLPEVRDAVRARVIDTQAAAQARKQGEELLAQLRKGGQGTLPQKAVVSRAQTEGLSRKAIDAVLSADVAKLPVYVGVDDGEQGFSVVRIDKVLAREAAGEDGARMTALVAQALTQAEENAYVEALKARFKAQISANPVPTESAASAAER